MRARSGRVIVLCTIILASLTGCGNFTLSGILDTPPGGPTGPNSLTIAPATVNAETNATVQFTASGGVGSYTWTASFGSVVVSGNTGTYTVPGTPDTYTVTVTDSTGGWREATIFASSKTPLVISPATVTLRAGSTFTFNASGGTSPYAYTVSDGSGTIDSSGLYEAPPTTAEVTNTIQVEDSALPTHAIVTAKVTLAEPPELTIAPLAITLVTGSTYAFTASGGVPTYSYSVLPGGAGGGVDSSGLYTAPGATGVDFVHVTDKGGRVC
jgi:hypothetical protein